MEYKTIYFNAYWALKYLLKTPLAAWAKNFQQILFCEFSREDEDSGQDRQGIGLGLGLVIVKRMTEKLSGEITFESQENAESRLHIRLHLGQ